MDVKSLRKREQERLHARSCSDKLNSATSDQLRDLLYITLNTVKIMDDDFVEQLINMQTKSCCVLYTKVRILTQVHIRGL